MTAYRVMIVDDEAIFRTGLTHLHDWKQEGIEIIAQAANGTEALELMDKARPHVVITDIMMPVMDGIELVKNLRNHYPHVKIIILSSFSEFELVREVFKYGVHDYLLKPKVTAQELVELIHTLCGDLFVEHETSAPILKDPSLLIGQWLEQEYELAAQEKAELMNIFQYNTFGMLIANVANAEVVPNHTSYELEQYMLQRGAEAFAGQAYSIVFTKQCVIVIWNSDDEHIFAMQTAQQQFVERVREAYHELIFVSSQHIHSIDELKPAYQVLLQCLQKTIYFAGKSIVEQERIIRENTDIPFDHEAFANALKWLTFKQAEEQLRQYFTDLNKEQAQDEYSVKRFIQHIIYTVMSTLEHLKLPITEQSMEKLKWFKRIDLAATTVQLEDIVESFLQNVQTQFNAQHDTNESNVLNMIIDHIHENYQYDISLSELADKFHMNYSYLSWYFKHRTNENLTAYINKVRIEKAKELLMYSDDSISQISSKIGFSEHNYFSKVFKKFTGMTPIEYRQAHSV